ncbi:FAD-dependent oxidoreductase [Sediminispirochaeta bajacaliforniensis]|uniref:FAD-dependent oxidoreductase n=1 Tax=Sediminispirochaeta bajacaliforniensis TaxID=148 RepID=UPI000375BA19|nr:FAD-dependent oxidoreductase [Sediminispirochaeta bajacaliforniensis]
MDQKRIVIIGGGGTGAAVARDLGLRGHSVLLLERDEFTGGTTGRHHGQLHSGARYAVGDREIARECLRETEILRRIAPDLIEDNGGLFVAVTDEEADYASQFRSACAEADIRTELISGKQAREIEPALSQTVRCAVTVPADGSFDAWRLPAAFFASAMEHGAKLFRYANVIGIETSGGSVSAVRVLDRMTNKEHKIEADVVINAGGPWVGKIAALAGLDMEVTPSPGTMVAVQGRFADKVISRLRPPNDGDIIVPQRSFSIIGTTQWITDDPDRIETPPEEIPRMLRLADEMIPAFSSAPFRAAWSAARPLAKRAYEVKAARALSRDFDCVHHKEEGAAGLFSLVGGKATVLRAMGEIVADQVCSYIGEERPGSSDQEKLPPYRRFYRLLKEQESERKFSWI